MYKYTKQGITPGVINMALQIRRGTDAERGLIVPAAGELIYTTDTKKLYVGDGTTSGGIEVNLSTSTYPVMQTRVFIADTRPAGTKGMIIFNDTTGTFQGFNGSKWVDLS